MELFSLTAGLVGGFLVLSAIYYFFFGPAYGKNYPPVLPGAWPIAGHAHMMSVAKFHTLMIEWGQQLKSDVYMVYFLWYPTVIINSKEAIHECLVEKSEEFYQRPPDISNQILDGPAGEAHGVIMANGPVWKENRRFVLHTLRDFGMGKNILEAKIIEEIGVLSERLAAKCSDTEGFNMLDFLTPSIANIIGSVVFGKRLDHDNPVLQRRLRYLSSITDAPFIIFIFGSILRKIPFLDLWKVKYWHSVFQAEFDFYQLEIDEHRKSLDSENIRDVIDAYLVEMETSRQLTGERDASKASKDGQLCRVIDDLFVAGTLTTSTTLQWAFLMMLVNPEIQEKVRAEIFEVVGQDRLPSTKDRPEMPYTESTLMEVQRFSTLATFGSNVAGTGTVKLCGYDIPKGALVTSNIYAVHRDPANFTDPHSFIADRFIDEDGKIKKPAAYMPFLVGKRMCLGESMAKMELFLFFVAVLQRFRLSLPPDTEKPSTEGNHKLGFMEPPAFNIVTSQI